MSKEVNIKKLEQSLTELLDKKSYIHYKRACTGKFRGTYDYGLTFEDGTKYFISNGKKYYLNHLTDAVKMYRYFHENREYLSRRTKEIIDRDNKQATSLGLKPVEFIDLNLKTADDGYNLFWIGFDYRHDGILYWKTETTFFYACRGIGLNDEKSVDAYFIERINRPDNKLGGLEEFAHKDFSKILLGYLYL